MKFSVENRCIQCPRFFCCADCRRKHERSDHGLEYDCPLCRGLKFLCKPKLLLTNTKLIEHITFQHLPLHCSKCNQMFNTMEDLLDIDKCSSVSELVDREVTEKLGDSEKDVDDKFNSLYTKMTPSVQDNFEAIVSINKINKTAVITPIIRKKHIVDYDSSSSESNSPMTNTRTPYVRAPKTPKIKRTSTPHHKKFLIKQRAIDIDDDDDDEENAEDSEQYGKTLKKEIPIVDSTTLDIKATPPNPEITTPTSRPIPNEKFSKLTASAVTTSTPTHAIPSNWCLFPEQGADSPLSEIEGTTGSPAQSIDNEGSKTEISENIAPKLKSIMMTGSRGRLGSQDSSEKQQTLLDSANNTEASVNKSKKVKFANDTVFKMEKNVLRVFRKPKRMLTPGPQKAGRFSHNPRFQALINRFEHNGKTMARTPITFRDKPETPQETPPGENNLNIQARAINFKDYSPASIDKVDDKEIVINELYQSCVESTVMNPNIVIHNAISTLTTNIAGSLQSCLSSAIQTEDEETEIQFKFVITKKKVSIKKIVDDGKDVDEKSCEIKRSIEGNKENIWTSVARAVKKVFWGDQINNTSTHLATTPLTRSQSSFESDLSSGSKRKCEDLSDVDSPINHKRQKCEGRIRGRPSIHGTSRLKPVANLKVSYSADQNSFFKQLTTTKDDTQNLSF